MNKQAMGGEKPATQNKRCQSTRRRIFAIILQSLQSKLATICEYVWMVFALNEWILNIRLEKKF